MDPRTDADSDEDQSGRPQLVTAMIAGLVVALLALLVVGAVVLG
jgi:hypothetical protein